MITLEVVKYEYQVMSSTETEMYTKRIKSKASVEKWMYKSIDHPSVLKYTLVEERYQDKLILPKGDKVLRDDISYEKKEEIVETLIDFLLFCEENGFIYADVKSENMIMVDDVPFMIDFDLICFPNLATPLYTQTYPDPKELNLRNKQDKTHGKPRYDLTWSIGIFVANLFDMTSTILRQDLRKHNLRLLRLGRWENFVKVCMSDIRPLNIKSLLPHIPIDIKRKEGKLHTSKVPDLPTEWNSEYDYLQPRWYYVIRNIYGFYSDFIMSFAMELYWRLRSTIIKELNEDSCAKLFYVLTLIAKVPCVHSANTGNLSFSAEIPIEELEKWYKIVLEYFDYKIPDIFIRGFSRGICHDDVMEKINALDAFVHVIGNPLNVYNLKLNVFDPTINYYVRENIERKVLFKYNQYF